MNSERAARIGILAMVAWGGAMINFWRGDPPVRAGNEVGQFRLLAADWFWLQADLAWEIRDQAKVRRLMKLAVAADPASRYFRVNGARMLAYDLPAWREAREPRVPEAVIRQRRVAGAEEALQFLRGGLGRREDAGALLVEMGAISVYALGDRGRAGEYFRQAAEQPGAPEYARRFAERFGGERR